MCHTNVHVHMHLQVWRDGAPVWYPALILTHYPVMINRFLLHFQSFYCYCYVEMLEFVFRNPFLDSRSVSYNLVMAALNTCINLMNSDQQKTFFFHLSVDFERFGISHMYPMSDPIHLIFCQYVIYWLQNSLPLDDLLRRYPQWLYIISVKKCTSFYQG